MKTLDLSTPGQLGAMFGRYFEILEQQKHHDQACPNGNCLDREDCVGYVEGGVDDL